MAGTGFPEDFMSGFSLSPHSCALGPALTPIFGTPAADVIAAIAEYQAIFGRAGGDVLSSQFNNTALFGGAGHDRIEICLDLADEVPVSLYEVTACVDGGLGEDRIMVDATLFSFDSPVAMSVHVNGGGGVRCDRRLDRLERVSGQYRREHHPRWQGR